MKTIFKYINETTAGEISSEQLLELVKNQKIQYVRVQDQESVMESGETVSIKAVYYRSSTPEEIAAWEQRKQNIQIQKEIAELTNYLDTEWRWKNERFYAELEEIELGLITETTETKLDIITARKQAVDKINALKKAILKK